MAWGQHQLVGGASLEMRRGRKTEYLDIPLKVSIKGWHLEWFIVENHGKSLPPRSGRQPDVRTLSWIESPTALEVTEARVLLTEICSAYPAYLYSGITDSTRVTNRKVSNVGTHVAYSAWNLPPPNPFSISCPTLLLVIVVWVLKCGPLLKTLRL
jgi:hypothetical protein